MALLGRTANGLFWMFRYIERAENTARLLDAGQRISLTNLSAEPDEWQSVLVSACVEAASAMNSPRLRADTSSFADGIRPAAANADSSPKLCPAAASGLTGEARKHLPAQACDLHSKGQGGIILHCSFPDVLVFCYIC